MADYSSSSHIISAPNEMALPVSPNIGISRCKWSPDVTTRRLAVSAWDGSVAIFDLSNATTRAPAPLRTLYHPRPVLSCCWTQTSTAVVSGGLDRSVRLCDLETGREVKLGDHADAVRCLEMTANGVISGGWDAHARLWDARIGATTPVVDMPCSDKVYALDAHGYHVLLGTRDLRCQLFDIRNPGKPEQDRTSPLKYQTRSIAFFPSGRAFVISSIEGRVAVEFVDAEDQQKKKYAFKCHRAKEADVELVYPVSALAFHPTYSTFATGGSDAIVNIWDPFNRKRLTQLRKFGASIASVSFSADGQQLAVAASYQYELDPTPQPVPDSSLTVRHVPDHECRPKDQLPS